MGVTKNDSTMKSEADQAQRKNLEVEIQQDKNGSIIFGVG